ncbi:MAG: DUF427 domain-containing protein [Gemmatimonadota bacterium]
MRRVRIVSSSGVELAAASESDAGVLELGGNWYFEPSRVNADSLEVTSSTYACPNKGTCRWVDYVGEEGRIPQVAWICVDPLPGYEAIRGRYGFYPTTRAGTMARVQPG